MENQTSTTLITPVSVPLFHKKLPTRNASIDRLFTLVSNTPGKKIYNEAEIISTPKTMVSTIFKTGNRRVSMQFEDGVEGYVVDIAADELMPQLPDFFPSDILSGANNQSENAAIQERASGSPSTPSRSPLILGNKEGPMVLGEKESDYLETASGTQDSFASDESDVESLRLEDEDGMEIDDFDDNYNDLSERNTMDDPIGTPRTPRSSRYEDKCPPTPKAPLHRRFSEESYIEAVYKDDLRVIQQIADNCIDINSRLNILLPLSIPEYSKSYIAAYPIFLATINGSPKMLERMLKLGANVNTVNELNQNALHILCMHAAKLIEEEDMKKRRHTEAVDGGNKSSFIDDDLDDRTLTPPRRHYRTSAVYMNNFVHKSSNQRTQTLDDLICKAQMLISYGIDISMEDSLGSLPLYYSTRLGLDEITAVIKQGVNPVQMA